MTRAEPRARGRTADSLARAGGDTLHRSALVWDAHADTLHRALVEGYDPGTRSPGHCDLDRWHDGGVRVQVLAIWVDPIFLPDHALRRALQQVDVCYRLIESYPDRVALARTADDVRRITADGRLAVMLALEGGAVILDDVAMLRAFHRLGVTSMTLTHSATTGWADSSTDTPRWHGLNDLGRSIIREMNSLGMVVDVSHVSDDAVRDVLAVSRAPVIASHSCCRALCDMPRNLPDELLRDIATAGGVVGINFYPPFLDEAARDAMLHGAGDLLRLLNEPVQAPAEYLDELAAQRHSAFLAVQGIPPVPMERVLDHIDHAAAIAGIDHVGLGSDFDGINATPAGLGSAAEYPAITRGLLARGYADDDVLKILGGNFLRVLEQVQDAAATMRLSNMVRI
jgi:membrane dipeptidase